MDARTRPDPPPGQAAGRLEQSRRVALGGPATHAVSEAAAYSFGARAKFAGPGAHTREREDSAELRSGLHSIPAMM